MPEYRYQKHFTLEQARALLPELRVIFAQSHKSKATLEESEETLSREIERTGGDLGGRCVRQLLESSADLHDGVAKIQGMGIEIKDLDRGLVDFPSIREGREVFLCWELEEDDIEFWHDLETGYAGRERL